MAEGQQDVPEDAEAHEVTKEDIDELGSKLEAWAAELPASQRHLVRTMIARAGAEADDVGGFASFGASLGEPISLRFTQVLQPSIGTKIGINPLAETTWTKSGGTSWYNGSPGGWSLSM